MENNYTKNVIENGKQNRKYLVEELENKINWLEEKAKEVEDEAKRFLDEAKKSDINFTLNINAIEKSDEKNIDTNNIIFLIKLLKNAKEKLLNLQIEEDTVLEEEKYINGAQTLLDQIDYRVEHILMNFKESNRNKINEAKSQKSKIQEELKNNEVETNELINQAENLNQEKDKLVKKIIKRKKIKERIENIDLELKDIIAKTNEKKKIKFELQQKEKTNHFIPETENEENQNMENTKEEHCEK